ncbi:MAG: VIT1/CCC1 transporter family protein [Desulfurococcus sp.]|nr:VIT1/CCC1 transporter family protein [Desulfurococcus sp.]
MSDPREILVDEYIDETVSARLYRFLAQLSGIRTLEDLALMEEEHAKILADLMSLRGVKPPLRTPFKALLKEKFYRLIARVFGYKLPLLLMERSEVEAIVGYWSLLEDPRLQDHRDKILRLLRDEVIHEAELYVRLHGYRLEVENMKDAVYGMIDALIEIEAGVIGIATATQPLIAGVAGLISSIAGSLSMSVGAYLSTKSENETTRSDVLKEKIIAEVDKARFLEKIREDLTSRGLTSEQASLIVKLASENPELLKYFTLRGVQEASPGRAAMSAGVFYMLGALGPILPFLLNLPALISIPLSLTLTLTVLFLLTLFVSLVSGARLHKLFLEYAWLTLLATLATFTIGLLAKEYLGLAL